MNFIKINTDLVKTVFILEDNEERIEFFNEVFKDCSKFITKNINVAIKELSRMKYDLIFLDHDLEELSVLDGSRPDYDENIATGYPVAKELRNTVNCETPCIIHSMNPTGASLMYNAHPFNTYAIPYHLLKESFIKEEKV